MTIVVFLHKKDKSVFKKKKADRSPPCRMKLSDLLVEIQSLENLLVTFRLVHLEIREEFTAACDHRQESTASGIILLVFLQVLRHVVNLLCENTDLDLRRTGVLGVGLEFSNDFLLIGFLESHSVGEKKTKGTSETILRASRKAQG